MWWGFVCAGRGREGLVNVLEDAVWYWRGCREELEKALQSDGKGFANVGEFVAYVLAACRVGVRVSEVYVEVPGGGGVVDE